MELWDAYDRNGNKTGGTLVRGQAIPEGSYHLVASVLVRHADGTYLLMKRDEHKESWPGVYEASAGGSVLKGETALEAARRELREETGLAGGAFTPLYFDRHDGYRTLYQGYLCETDADKQSIVMQAGETCGFLWATGAEIMQMADVRPYVVADVPGMLAYIRAHL